MRLLFLLTLFAVQSMAVPRSVALIGGLTGTSATPTGLAVYSAIGTVREEMRIHDDSTTGGYRPILDNGRLVVRVYEAGGVKTISCLDSIDTGSPSNAVTVTGWTDMLIRYTRCHSCSPQRTILEVWKTGGTPSEYRFSTTETTMSTTPDWRAVPWTFGSASLATKVAWVRIFNTAVPLNSTPPAELGGQLGQWEFSDNGTDSSANALNITFGGTATYSDTPTVGVVARVAAADRAGDIPGIRAGRESAVSLVSASYSPYDATIASCRWTITSSNYASQKIADNNACSTTAAIYTAGQYDYRLTVTDSAGNVGTTTVAVGAVATDDNNVVLGQSALFTDVFGQQTRHTTETWPWFYKTSKAAVDALDGQMNPSSLLTTASSSGTVSWECVTGTPPNCTGTKITGVGTQLLTDFPSGGAMLLIWSPPGQPANSGRLTLFFNTPTTETSAVVNNPGYYTAPAAISGVQYIPLGTTALAELQNYWTTNLNGSWNFYCGGDCPFRTMYAKTGLTKYLTQAELMSGYWWQFVANSGYNVVYPRNVSSMGLVASTEATSGRWNGMTGACLASTLFSSLFEFSMPTQDVRENGYKLWCNGIAAKNTTVSGDRTLFCNRIVAMVDGINASIGTYGGIPMQFENSTLDYPYQGRGVTAGTQPWHQSILALGLFNGYEALVNPAVCNDSARATTTLATAKSIIDYAYDYGYDTVDRAVYYSEGYPSAAQSRTLNPGGTVSTTIGSPTITGTTTTFTTTFAPCDGTKFIHFMAAGSGTVYRVTACASDTSATLEANYGTRGETQTNLTNSAYNSAPQSATDCNSLATYCERAPDYGTPNPGREYNPLLAHALARYYKISGNATYRTRALELLSAMYGGPADGMGGIEAASGAGADGGVSDYFGNCIHACTAGPIPCGGTSAEQARVKWCTGEHNGAGNTDGTIGMITAAQAADNRTYTVGFTPSGTFAKIKLYITKPDGTVTSPAACTGNCSFTYDARQGAHLLRWEYLSNLDVVLAATSGLVPVQ